MEQVVNELKQLILKALDLEDMTPQDLDPEQPLFGEGLGLDSIDALELGIAIQKKYSIQFKQGAEENKQHFYSIQSLANFIAQNRP